MKLYPHQQRILKETKDFTHVAYYLDMGLGKTYVGSEKMLHIGNKINLVVCQKSKIQDWIDHFKNNYVNITVYNLTNNDELLKWAKVETPNSQMMVGVINYELAWRRPPIAAMFNYTLMLDESSLIQNTSAKQTKFILKLKPKNVILLSGTPVGGKYENLWSQMHLIGWDISEALYNRTYVNWKMIEVAGFNHWIVDKDDPYKNIDRLKQKMREHGSVFMKTEECFDLPDQNFNVINVPTGSRYKKFMKDFYISFSDDVYVNNTCDPNDNGEVELVGETSLTKMLYARQLCGMYSAEKLDSFEDILQSTNDRLVVFYNWNLELYILKEICEEYNRPVSEVNGHRKDLSAFEQFDNSVTLVQYQAGAKGLNLQKANRIIYFTLPLSSENFEQSKKRIHRIGQDKPCFYYLMICKDSIEEKILKTLEERKDYTDELFKEQLEANFA